MVFVLAQILKPVFLECCSRFCLVVERDDTLCLFCFCRFVHSFCGGKRICLLNVECCC